jgi:maltose/maltodextrin transport system permease protein
MVGIAPLVIASFAFNFNAFVNIFLLTQGGPAVNGYDVPFGETDILISFIFDLAVQSGRGGQFALAAAATFFLFLIVATISAISFRFTKRLETIYGNL